MSPSAFAHWVLYHVVTKGLTFLITTAEGEVTAIVSRSKAVRVDYWHIGNFKMNIDGHVQVQGSELQIHLLQSPSSHRSREDTCKLSPRKNLGYPMVLQGQHELKFIIYLWFFIHINFNFRLF